MLAPEGMIALAISVCYAERRAEKDPVSALLKCRAEDRMPSRQRGEAGRPAGERMRLPACSGRADHVNERGRLLRS